MSPGNDPRLQRPLTYGVMGLLVLAACFMLHFARVILAPLCLALFAALALQPGVSLLQAGRVPRWMAASLVVLSVVVSVGGVGALLSEPASIWIERAPRVLSKLEQRTRA
jgi:predicted PurR-regulated permease PerM